MTPKTTRHEGERFCPCCGTKVDTSTHHTETTPSPGDVAVCLYCSSVSLYKEDLTLREPTREELDTLLTQVPELSLYVAASKAFQDQHPAKAAAAMKH